MSTLERVIAEQQTEIDGMKIVIASQQKSIFTVFTRNTELFEKFGELLDAQVPDRTNETAWKRYQALLFECRILYASVNMNKRNKELYLKSLDERGEFCYQRFAELIRQDEREKIKREQHACYVERGEK